MKTFINVLKISGCIIIFSLFTFPPLYGQQSGFSYQAVARDQAGEPIRSGDLTVRFAIHLNSEAGTLVWQEDHDVTTGQLGLFDLIVGGPDAYGGTGSANSFDEIDWSSGPYFLKVSVKTDGNFTDMGGSLIRTVPVAQYAELANSAKNASGNFSVQADKVAGDGEALFEVRRSDGSVAFAVYEDMVWVYVDTSDTKGVKGGFAVGGYTNSKGTGEEFLRVTPDSIRMYINTDPPKGVKGGFAVGGYTSSAKASVPGQEFLSVTKGLVNVKNDSIRMYVNSNPAKGVKGGFAVGGYTNSKADADNFMTLTEDNYFIGQSAGLNNTKGIYNAVLGYEAAMQNTEGSNNVFIGYRSGHNNTGELGSYSDNLGSENVFIGYQSGFKNVLGLKNIFIGTNAGYNNIGEVQTDPFYLTYGSLNIFIGNEAGYNNVSGWTNLFLGNSAGHANISGSDNTFVGNLAGQNNTDGKANTFVGTFSGRSNSSGNQNVCVGFYAGNKNEAGQNTFVGTYSGEKNVTGQNNTCIGAAAGQNSAGFGNVFIGYGAGSNEAGNNKLYIANSPVTTPLIGGDFGLSRVALNGSVGVNGDAVAGYALYVHGEAITTSTAWQVSDVRYKTDINAIDNALSKVLKLNGVTFRWNDEALAMPGYNETTQIGLIAQEVQEQIPELVKTAPDGSLSVSYSNLTAVLIEAIKEQQKELDEKEARIRMLEERLDRLEENF